MTITEWTWLLSGLSIVVSLGAIGFQVSTYRHLRRMHNMTHREMWWGR